MATRIYKYRVYVGASVSIYGLVRVLLFGPQGSDGLFVWAEVNDEVSKASTLDVLPTGSIVAPGARHHASCQEGAFVWHLYERAGR